jgi:hypothetical protein
MPLWTPEDSSDSLGSVGATGVAPAARTVPRTLRVTKGGPSGRPLMSRSCVGPHYVCSSPNSQAFVWAVSMSEKCPNPDMGTEIRPRSFG